jgi:negative regulator of flagellin synthesis FlgM
MKIPGENVVASKINGVEAKTARIAPASSVAWRAAGTQPAPERPAASEADVHLTGAARGLAAIEESLRALPVVDEARVAAVKERLQSGNYEVNPQRVADRLLRMEGDLLRAQPPGKTLR